MSGFSDVSVVCTSCRRHDHLAATLCSFLAANPGPFARFVVIEDSDEERVRDVVAGVSPEIDVIVNGDQLGQHRSIDRAYATLDAPYIYHLEDDWAFDGPGGVAATRTLIEACPNAVVALDRTHHDMPRYVRSLKVHEHEGVRYRRVFPEIHHLWHTFTFNPGMRRLADWRALPGGYGGFTFEEDASVHYKREGRDLVWWEDSLTAHSGGHDSISKRPVPFSLATRAEVVSQSLGRKFWHGLRRLGVDTELMQRRMGRGRR